MGMLVNNLGLLDYNWVMLDCKRVKLVNKMDLLDCRMGLLVNTRAKSDCSLVMLVNNQDWLDCMTDWLVSTLDSVVFLHQTWPVSLVYKMVMSESNLATLLLLDSVCKD